MAAVVQNAGPGAKFISETVPAPTRGRLAVLWRPEKWMLWEGDVLQNFSGDTEVLLGTELNWNQMGFLRVGYRYTSHFADLGTLTGASFGVGVNWKAVQMDYAFLPYGDLGDSHRISLAWRFSSDHE